MYNFMDNESILKPYKGESIIVTKLTRDECLNTTLADSDYNMLDIIGRLTSIRREGNNIIEYYLEIIYKETDENNIESEILICPDGMEDEEDDE